MALGRLLGRAGGVALAALAAVAGAGAASAQSWDWGGGSTVGGSGRESVSFNASFKPGQLIASFSDRRLYLVTQTGRAYSYPIAIPREQSRWQGVMSVSEKRVNPSWTPTPTMRAENPRLPNWVPGGHPMNPLGVRALYLGSSAYRIHGTDAPWTIGQPVSKGCIRMYNQDVIDLYDRVPTGTRVTVTWQSFGSGGGGTQVASAAPVEAEPQRAAPAQRAPRVSRRSATPDYQYESIFGTAAPEEEAAPAAAPAPAAPRKVTSRKYVPASAPVEPAEAAAPASPPATSAATAAEQEPAAGRKKPVKQRTVAPKAPGPVDDAAPYSVDEDRPSPRKPRRVRSVSVE